MTIADGNVGAAIGLVCGAGAATAIGASVVFFPALVKRASRRVLAASLGLSAGVMIYVSFVEIFFKSIAGFADSGMDENTGYIYATLSFFGGVLVMKIVDICVRRLSGEHAPRRKDYTEDIQIVWNEDEGCCEMNEESTEPEIVAPHCVGCSDDPVKELNEWIGLAEQEIQARNQEQSVDPTRENSTNNDNDDEETGDAPKTKPERRTSSEEFADNDLDAPRGGNKSDSYVNKRASLEGADYDQDNERRRPNVLVHIENVPRAPDEDRFFRAPARPSDNPKEEKKKLVKMGLGTALAIAIHNFPEGLATFVAALDDPSVGAVLAIAIGIHNIPEGLCVALPIYYATGNRWKAFLWGCFSGLTEPLAALLGWLVLANAVTDTVYAVLFGFVSGMMVMISFKELIPTAHRYDPEDTVVTYSLIIGMAIMALSLVLFKV